VFGTFFFIRGGDRNISPSSQSMEYENSKVSALIDEWIHNERNREILKRRYIDGILFEPLAEEFDMSVRQIKNIVYRGGTTVFSHYK
jgi:hypothetical protein